MDMTEICYKESDMRNCKISGWVNQVGRRNICQSAETS